MNITSCAELCDYIDQGGQVKYLFFWGHRPAKDGVVTKSCFSQWFESPFEIDGVQYPTAEHFMMAEKARLFSDHDVIQRILVAATPGAAKALGREIKNFEDGKWLAHRWQIVVNANLAKFSRNKKLQEFLLNTADRVLVEASPVDRIWGIGLAAEDSAAENPNTWNGLNLLGFALMQVREQLRVDNNL